MGKAFIGTSGWQYAHWQGKFYPRDLPQKDWLGFYAQYFSAVEVNATFYHRMRKEVFVNWRNLVDRSQPTGGFTFSIKGSRFITHIKRLKDCSGEVKRFLDSATGCCSLANENIILWQLPPQMKADKERLKQFLKLSFPWRQAVEFRHASWLDEEIYSILKEGKSALVIQDSPNWPVAEVLTADFVYLRFHGKESLYASCYSQAELKTWATKIKKWLSENLDVYAFFNNDAEGFAVQNAGQLKELIGTS